MAQRAFIVHIDISGGSSAISATPFVERAESGLVATDPGLGFHETPAFRTALGSLDERGTSLARLVTLVAHFLGYPAMLNRLNGSPEETFYHLISARLHS